MPNSHADRNLLFGILALQMDFICRDALIAAMNAWVLDKTKPLGQILCDHHALTPDNRAWLEAGVDRHLALHGNDAEKSLAAVSSVGSLRKDLEQIADPDVQASLAHVAVDPNASTISYVGTPTSTGLRFRVIRLHKRGGLGEVYVAHDEELHREVALKEIQNKHADHPGSRSRFLLEAEITGGLEHPCIVPVYGLGQYSDGRPFYAMRFIRGDSLQDAIKSFHQNNPEAQAKDSDRNLELRKLLGRFIDVCQAIQYAHDRGVLHRDLKPGNIMLGKYGETLVVDWGLAKAAGRPNAREPGAHEEPSLHPKAASGVTATVYGSTLGTPQYMSPEQASGRLDQLGPATDVYSLGATFYCLLTGKPPVEDKDTAVVLQKVQQADFPPPRKIKPSVDPALEAVCLKAMEFDPADRYESPRDLADDIEHWLADKPVSAHAEPMTVKAGRWMRRHKPLVSGAAASLLVGLVALSAGAIWYESQKAEAVQKQLVADAEAARKQAIAEEKVVQGLDQARKTRDELHKILKKPGGVHELLNRPARWEAQIKSARSDWQRANDNAGATAGAPWMNQLKLLDQDLARDQADYELAMRLERIRMDRATVGEEQRLDFTGARKQYAAAFAEAGLSPVAGRQKEVAVIIQQSAIKEQLVAALDDWAHGAEAPTLLLDVARLADPDPWRDRVRDPELWTKKQSLEKLVRDAELDGEFLARQPPQILFLLSTTLSDGRMKETWERLVQSRHPADFWIAFSLAVTLVENGNFAEAIGFYHVALAIRPNNAAVYNNLGSALYAQKKLSASVDAYRRSLAINSRVAVAWGNLGIALLEQKKFSEAIEACENAVAIKPQYAEAWTILGTAQLGQKKLPEAIDAFKTAIEIDPKLLPAWHNFGLALGQQKEALAAIDAFKNALAIDPKHADSQKNLAVSQNIVTLEKRLHGVLGGDAVSAAELLVLANFSGDYKEGYRDAAELYAKAFLAQPGLADQLPKAYRYTAARYSALAAAGKGIDADKLDAKARAELRKKALDWLQDDLIARAKLVELEPVETYLSMKYLQHNSDLTNLRDEKELTKLPADEQAALKKFWDDVESLAKRARAGFMQTEQRGQFTDKDQEQIVTIKAIAGKTCFIDMESTQFKTSLRLEDEKGKVLAKNDGIDPTNLNSRIGFTPSKDGVYRIVATSFQQAGRGEYQIIIRQYASAKSK